MRSLAQWLEYLEQLHPSAIDMGLERVAAVRDRLGIQLDMPVISVGGTNGKGSVCAYLDAMLRQAGFRAGLYTSPHLVRYNERVRIDGVEVSDALLIEAFERIEHARGRISLTYFEFGTLAAALIFSEAQVEACPPARWSVTLPRGRRCAASLHRLPGITIEADFLASSTSA